VSTNPTPDPTPFPTGDRQIWYCDSTLRDGSHPKRHQISVEEVRSVAGALDRAGVPWIEVSHGDGLGGSSFNYGFSLVDEYELMAVALEEMTQAHLAVLLLPGIGTKDELRKAYDVGARLVRVATHCTEADIAPQHIALARELGYLTVGFLMMAHMQTPEGLLGQARIMADAGAQIVYCTDSAGAMTGPQVAARVAALRDGLPDGVQIGFHGHHNLSLGVANSLVAMEHGATWVDGSTCGLGAGAGNTPTEIFVAVCDKLGIKTGMDAFALMDAAEESVRPIMDHVPLANREALLLGYAGVYSSFLLHADRAAQRFGVSSKDILIEAGRRQAVGGQEDLLIDIAAELASADRA
jgi:4-hydroxy 2-oxovalerate aldolase